MNRSAVHTALVRQILATLGAEPDLLLAVNESGRARYMSRSGKEFLVPYGFPSQKGGPDIIGVLGPRGTFVAMEVKTGEATTTADQRRVHEGLRMFGALVYVVRSVDEARRAVADARGRRAA